MDSDDGNMGQVFHDGFSSPHAVGPDGQGLTELADRLRAANRTAEERRQEAEMRAEVVNREAEQQAHHEYAAALGRSVPAGNGSGSYPGSSSDLVATLVSMLQQQQQNQSQRMLDMMGARLDRLEAP